jgi:hypothetical protein
MGSGMTKCPQCSMTVLFGGVRDGAFRYCSKKCHAATAALMSAVPAQVVAEEAAAVHASACPRCKGPGPVDLHTSHVAWSLVVVSVAQDFPFVCCTRCARKQQARATLVTALLGWWGFPFGLVFTPVQVCRNIVGMTRRASTDGPSPSLVSFVQKQIAAGLPSVGGVRPKSKTGRLTPRDGAASGHLVVG